MSLIDTQNDKNIRDTMDVKVIVGPTASPLFTFDNSNLLSCELNLRSDLKPIDPSLPESEIVITAYWPEDVSQDVLLIDTDTVITYQAGYAGDMSTVRKFYLAEQIQWSDKVLTVHGVDAVHFLDGTIDPFFIGNHFCTRVTGTPNQPYTPQAFSNVDNAFQRLYAAFRSLISDGGFSFSAETSQTFTEQSIAGTNCVGVCPRQSRRDLIANMMNLLRLSFPNWGFGASSFWLNYVDAGQPRVTQSKPTSKWTIYEADCGDIKRQYETPIKTIEASLKRVDISPWTCVNESTQQTGKYSFNQKVGSAEIFNNSGAGLTFDVLASNVYYTAHRDAPPSNYVYSSCEYFNETLAIKDNVPVDYQQKKMYGGVTIGKILYDTESFSWQNWNDSTSLPHAVTLATYWNSLSNSKYIETGNDTVSVDLFGGAYNLYDKKETYSTSGEGITAKPQKTTWCGSISARGTAIYNILPDKCFSGLLDRSNEIGSFTWKGDPRMQPRDVFTFWKLDGTTETRTIESINLKHEGGGTVATITYRKGIV